MNHLINIKIKQYIYTHKTHLGAERADVGGEVVQLRRHSLHVLVWGLNLRTTTS